MFVSYCPGSSHSSYFHQETGMIQFKYASLLSEALVQLSKLLVLLQAPDDKYH